MQNWSPARTIYTLDKANLAFCPLKARLGMGCLVNRCWHTNPDDLLYCQEDYKFIAGFFSAPGTIINPAGHSGKLIAPNGIPPADGLPAAGSALRAFPRSVDIPDGFPVAIPARAFAAKPFENGHTCSAVRTAPCALLPT